MSHPATPLGEGKAVPARSHWLEEVARKVASLGGLIDGWDGYGARTIDRKIILAATNFATWLANQILVEPMVVPLSDGRLQFEWHDGPKTLELEFESPTRIHFLKWNPEAGVEEENVISIQDKNAIVELLQWFMED